MAAGTVSDSATLTQRLSEYLAAVERGRPHVTVGESLSGGWSVHTFRLRVDDRDRVLRVAAPDHPLATNAALEARLMARAAAAGIPTPGVIHVEEDPAWLGSPFAILEFVSGAAPNVWSARRMGALLEATSAERLLDQMIDVALRIPGVADGTDELPAASVLGMPLAEYSIVADIDRWLDLLESSDGDRPVLDLAGRWLRDNAPPDRGAAFQHHDFRLGNMMFDAAGQVAAVVDWEFAGAGDRLCDIGYAAQPYCLGRLLKANSSLDLPPDPTSWVLRRYAERSSEPVEEERLRYFVALGIFKMAIALVVPARAETRAERTPHQEWLELPILSLTDDLVAAIRRSP